MTPSLAPSTLNFPILEASMQNVSSQRYMPVQTARSHGLTPWPTNCAPQTKLWRVSGMRQSARRFDLPLLAVVLALTVVAYAQFLGSPFFGSDTWPWLASSRVATLGDAVRLAFSPIMPGTQ